MWSQSTNVTVSRDGQTDDMRLQDRALHYRASRGKNHLEYVVIILQLQHEEMFQRLRHSTNFGFEVRTTRSIGLFIVPWHNVYLL